MQRFFLLFVLVVIGFTINPSIRAQTAPVLSWQKCLGGDSDDVESAIIRSEDGGYIMAGATNSINGDVSGLHGKSYDAWIVKLNSSGSLQ